MRIERIRIRNFRTIIDRGEISLDENTNHPLGKNEYIKIKILGVLESSFGGGFKYGCRWFEYPKSNKGKCK